MDFAPLPLGVPSIYSRQSGEEAFVWQAWRARFRSAAALYMGVPTIKVIDPRDIHVYAVGCAEDFASMTMRILRNAYIEMIEFVSI